MVKDYSFIFRDNPKWSEKADWVSQKAKDITEVLMLLKLKAIKTEQNTTVAYHSACSMQHGQNINEEPKALLEKVGFKVDVPVEAHLCCGSAGAYSLTQPGISNELRDRKIANLTEKSPDVIVTAKFHPRHRGTISWKIPKYKQAFSHLAANLDTPDSAPCSISSS